MSTNTITVTASDNELIILAFQWGASYEVARILSGNSQPVSVTLNLSVGQYNGPVVLNGVNTPLNVSLPVSLPAGDYSLDFIGINWGGPTQFTAAVNKTTISLPYNASGPVGVAWSPTPIAITVQ